MDGREKEDPLRRENSTAVISHIEILADLTQYAAILSSCSGEEPGGLLLVQKGEEGI